MHVNKTRDTLINKAHYNNLNKNFIKTILFLNVMKVFDNVSHERLFHNLKKKRINSRIMN